MNEQIEKLSNVEKSEVTFTPFGAADAIKLTVALVQRFVAVKTKSGKTCTNEDAVKFIALCQAQRLNPFAGDAFLVGYDTREGTAKFSLITSHVAFIKRAETCPDYEGMESGIILLLEGGEVKEREGDFKLPAETCVGGWARVYRKGRKPMYRRLSIDAMRPPYETAFWNDAKAPGQICKCAEADALRATFPTLIGGLYTEGESSAFIIDIEPKHKQPLPTFAALPAFVPETSSPAAATHTTGDATSQPAKDVSEKPAAAVLKEQQPAASGERNLHAEFEQLFADAGIGFNQFIRCEAVLTDKTLTDPTSLADWHELPTAWLQNVSANPKRLTRLIASAKAATT